MLVARKRTSVNALQISHNPLLLPNSNDEMIDVRIVKSEPQQGIRDLSANDLLLLRGLLCAGLNHLIQKPASHKGRRREHPPTQVLAGGE